MFFARASLFRSPSVRRWSAVVFAWFAALAMAPLRGQTVEEVCRSRDTRIDGSTVRVAWTNVLSDNDGVNVTYCVLHGDTDARLSFERNAEIVYFALSTAQRRPGKRAYTFTIKTSTGRTIRQGPAIVQPLGRQPQTCRVDVCQFFTEPGERVVSVAVETRRD
jgi:hypothetical protein